MRFVRSFSASSACAAGLFVASLLLVSASVTADDAAPARASSAEWAEVLPLPEQRAPTTLRADTQGGIRFDSKTPFDFDVLLNHADSLPTTTTSGHLYLPEGASAERPVPGMVVLPGSGGVKLGRQMLYADLLVSHGYAALVVDYYESRGIDDDVVPYPIMVGNVTEFDVVTDAYAALRVMHDHPSVDAERVGVMGFSYGGMATRLALDTRLREILAPSIQPFAAHVDFYGPCLQEFHTPATTGAPLLTLRGGRDDSNDLVACAQQEQRLREAGSEVSSVVYATAGHSWGNLGPRFEAEATYVRGCVMDYDESGLPSVRSQQLIPSDAPIDRASRYRLRMASGRFFEGCLEKGYIVGRDEATHQAANAALLRFLDEKLGK